MEMRTLKLEELKKWVEEFNRTPSNSPRPIIELEIQDGVVMGVRVRNVNQPPLILSKESEYVKALAGRVEVVELQYYANSKVLQIPLQLRSTKEEAEKDADEIAATLGIRREAIIVEDTGSWAAANPL